MRARGWSAGLLMPAALTLGACATEDAGSGGAQVSSNAGVERSAAPGGVTRTGASIATMSGQYAHPRPVGPAATGASAWVGPVPQPAYVVTGPLPPADPPPPPPAAVANREPSAPETPASDVVRPEAAAPQPQAEGAANVDFAEGRTLFNQWSCGTCHILADANGSGGVGPSLDGNDGLSQEAIVRIVSDGQGAMPAFGGQIGEEDIATLADYIMAAKK